MVGLILGGGSKLGLELSTLLSKTYDLTLITSNPTKLGNVREVVVNWQSFGLKALNTAIYHFIRDNQKLDLIIFNQNSKQGPNTVDFFDPDYLNCLYKNWISGYRSDCMISYYVVQNLAKHIHENTKICWMFSGLINEYIEVEKYNHAAYRSIKLTNYFIMNSFNAKLNSIFCGIDPGHITEENRLTKAEQIVEYLNGADHASKGKVFAIESNSFWDPSLPNAMTGPI